MKFSFLLLLPILFFSNFSQASYSSKKVIIQCPGEKEVEAILTMQFASKDWGYQCIDLTPYSYKSEFWVHPGSLTLETNNATYEVDTDMSEEKKCNKGVVEPYSTEDVSCSQLMKEYDENGVTAIYQKKWDRAGNSSQHMFYLKNSKGETALMYLGLDSYYPAVFAGRGYLDYLEANKSCDLSEK